MPLVKSIGPDAEVIGQNLMSFVESANQDLVQPLLKKRGLDQLEPDKWYPLQSYVDLMNDMVEADPAGSASAFVSIGMKIVEKAVFPPEIDNLSLKEILLTWNDSYKLNCRGEDIGEMKAEVVSDTHIKMHCQIPYADDVNYGVFYAVAQRWLPEGTDFTVYYEEEPEEPRRDEGGEWTIYNIEWEA